MKVSGWSIFFLNAKLLRVEQTPGKLFLKVSKSYPDTIYRCQLLSLGTKTALYGQELSKENKRDRIQSTHVITYSRTADSERYDRRSTVGAGLSTCQTERWLT
jgi:hypothetical protein